MKNYLSSSKVIRGGRESLKTRIGQRKLKVLIICLFRMLFLR